MSNNDYVGAPLRSFQQDLLGGMPVTMNATYFRPRVLADPRGEIKSGHLGLGAAGEPLLGLG